MRAGRVARLPRAVQADQRLVATEVDDDTHRGDQPGIEILSPAVRRNVQRAVVAAGRIGAAIEIAADGTDPPALAGWHVGRQLGGARCPGIAVQLAPLPGRAVAAQLGREMVDGGRQAAREDGRLVFLLRRVHIVPVGAVVTPEQMIGLRRIGGVGALDQRLPGGTVVRAELIEKDHPRAFMQECRVQGGIAG